MSIDHQAWSVRRVEQRLMTILFVDIFSNFRSVTLGRATRRQLTVQANNEHVLDNDRTPEWGHALCILAQLLESK